MRVASILFAVAACAIFSGPVFAASDAPSCQGATCLSRPIQFAKDCSRQKQAMRNCQANCKKQGRGKEESCIGPCMYDWENCMNGN